MKIYAPGLNPDEAFGIISIGESKAVRVKVATRFSSLVRDQSFKRSSSSGLFCRVRSMLCLIRDYQH